MQEFLNEYPPDSFYSNHVQYHLVKYYKEKENYKQAAREAQKLVDLYPNCTYAADMKYQIGDFLAKAGNKNKAKKHYEKIVFESKPNTEPAAIGQFLLAEMLDEEGSLEEARAAYSAVKTKHGDVKNWAILSDYALAMTFFKEWTQYGDTASYRIAMEMLDEFVAKYPTDKRTPMALLNKAHMLKKAQKWEEAVFVFDNIIDFDLSNISNVAPGHLETEQEAIRDLIVKSKKQKADIYVDKLDREVEAKKIYDQILNEYPDNYEVLFRRALLLIKMEMNDEARVDFKKLTEKGSPFVDVAEEYLSKLNN